MDLKMGFHMSGLKPFLEIRGFRMVFLGGVDIFFLKGSTELTQKWGAD